MARLDQFNIGIYAQDDADKLPAAHSIIDHYKADHRGMSKFTALYELLVIADQTLRSRPDDKNSIPMDRTPMERRMGADFDEEHHWKQSGTSQVVRRRPRSRVTPPKAHDV